MADVFRAKKLVIEESTAWMPQMKLTALTGQFYTNSFFIVRITAP